jgi:hypothetical protein
MGELQNRNHMSVLKKRMSSGSPHGSLRRPDLDTLKRISQPPTPFFGTTALNSGPSSLPPNGFFDGISKTTTGQSIVRLQYGRGLMPLQTTIIVKRWAAQTSRACSHAHVATLDGSVLASEFACCPFLIRQRAGGESCIVKYRKILLSCACGQIPGSLSTVGLTADNQLVIQWRCPRCNREVHVFKPLADCWRDCPKEGDTGHKDSQATSEKGFLRDMEIKDEGL